MKVEFAPPAGLVSDETTFSTPQWVDGNNVRFRWGRPETIGGWATACSTALTGVCRNALAWADIAGNTNIAFGTHNALQVYVGGNLADITPGALPSGSIDGAGGPGYGTGNFDEGTYGTGSASSYYARTWSLATWGENLMACPRGGTIYLWENDTGVDAAAIANAPDNINVILVTPERIVLALGCNEEVSTDFNPMCIRGCKVGDYTDWTSGLAADDAFEHILEGGGGRIVGAKMVGNYVAVWTDTSLHLGQYVGVSTQKFRFDPVANNCGLLGPNAGTVVNGTAYWITPDLIPYAWQPGAPPQALPCPIRNDFADNLVSSQTEKVVACPIGKFGEIWWLYPDARDGIENSRYIAVNPTEGTWFKGQIARTAAIDAGPTQYPLMATYAGATYWHENGNSADGSVLEWSLTSGDQYLSKAQQVSVLRGIWPDFEDQQGPVSLSLTLRNYPQATTTYSKGPYALAPNASKRDFMASGRVVAMTFSGSSSPSFARFGKPVLDVVAAGAQ